MTAFNSDLSELNLLTSSGLFSSIFKGDQNLGFYAYTNDQAAFNLRFETFSSRTDRVACALYGGPSTSSSASKKAPVIARAFNVDLDPKRLGILIGHVKSKMEKVGADWIWTIHEPPPSWELRMTLPAYDASVPARTELMFRWKRCPLAAGMKPNLSNPDWKLVLMNGERGEVGEVHAVLSVKVDRSKERGQLQFRRSYGRDWELGVMTAAGVLSEHERMRKDRRGRYTNGSLLW